MYRDIKIIAVKYTVIKKLFHISDLQILIIMMMIGAVVLLIFCFVLFESKGFGGWIPERPCRNIISFTLGISVATLVLNILHLFGVLDKIREKKMFFKTEK